MIENGMKYKLRGEEEKNGEWGVDVFRGSGCVGGVMKGYLSGEGDGMDEVDEDGIVGGLFIYGGIEGVEGEEGRKEMEEVREVFDVGK